MLFIFTFIDSFFFFFFFSSRRRHTRSLCDWSSDVCSSDLEGTEEGDKLDVLLALVDIYEAKRWPIAIDETFDPVDALRYAIDELGHTQAELADLLGSRSRASEALSRRRALTVEMIHSIGEAWKIP